MNTSFLQMLSNLHKGRVLRVLHGPVLYQNQRKGPGGIIDTFPNDPPLTVILEYLRIKVQGYTIRLYISLLINKSLLLNMLSSFF